MRFLRQNTAVIVTVGPFFSITDGLTPLNAITTVANIIGAINYDDDDGTATHAIHFHPAATGTANDMTAVGADGAGLWNLELAAANTDYVGRMILSLTDPAQICPVFHEFTVLAAAVYDQMFGTTGDSTGVTEILTRVPNATPGEAGGLFIAGTNAPTTITTSLTTTFTGNLTGSAGSVTGAVGSVTGAVGSVTGAVGSVTGNVGGTVASVVGNVGGNVVGTVASVVGAVGSVTGAVGSVTGAVGSVTGHTAQTGDSYAIVNSGTFGNAAIKTQTGVIAAILSGITSLANWLRGIFNKRAMDATAQTEIRDTTGTFDPATDSVEALRDRGDAAWVTATSVTVSDKTGFSLSQAFPTNFAAMGISVGGVVTASGNWNTITPDVAGTLVALIGAKGGLPKLDTVTGLLFVGFGGAQILPGMEIV